MLHKEVSFEDMLGITTLAVFEPKLYLWIYNNKTIVCEGSHPKYFKTIPECRQFYYDCFTNMGIDPYRAIDCIAIMFPKSGFAQFESYFDRNARLESLKSMMHIGAEEKFELYFENIKFSRSPINNCLSGVDVDKLVDELGNISEEVKKVVK